MVESDFQRHLKEGLETQGIYIQKISDLARGQRKEFDFHACVQGKYWALECKLSKFKEQIPSLTSVVVRHKDMQSHQLKTLETVVKAGGKGWIAAGFYHETNFRLRYAFLVPVNLFKVHANWTLLNLTSHSPVIQLIWTPGAGWCLPSTKPSS